MKYCIALLGALLAGASPSAAQDLAAADAELNQLYQKIESRLASDHAAKQKLVTAQRAWIVFRDDECKFAASGVEGGSVYSEVVQSCKQDLTQARIANFNTYLNCEEGDLSCPVPAN